MNESVFGGYWRRRSCLSVPGSSDKMVRKAATLTADEIIFDLEDGVAATEKPAARARVAAALAGDAFAARTVGVRINAIGSPWCHEDILAFGGLAHPRLALIVPKLESAGDLAFLDRFLAGLEAGQGRPMVIALEGLIETAAGLANVGSIAGASSRLQALILGYADLASSLGRPAVGPWDFARDSLLVAARANGLQALDGPHFDLADEPGLERASAHAAALGFDGKWAIHPAQLDVINTAFTPSAEAVRKAREILARLDALQHAGRGAGLVDGAMVDEAMRVGAARTLAMSEDPAPAA